MCEVDWSSVIGVLGAIASILTSLIAYIVYTNWKTQKIKELISQEAKSLFNIIQDFRFELVSIRLGLEKNINKDFSNEIDQLHSTLVGLYSQDRLFNYLIGNGKMIENQSIDDSYRTKLQNICIDYLRKLRKFNSIPHQSRILDMEFIKLVNDFDRALTQEIKDLLTHVKYGDKV